MQRDYSSLVQDAQELNDPEKVSATWVKHLYGLVDELNDTETEMIGMKPKDAIVLDQVPLVNREAYRPEEVLPEDGLYQYLLQPCEEHDDQRCRAMDRIWSKETYRLREIIISASLSCCSLIVQAFLGTLILLKPFGGLEQNLRCI